MKRPTRPMRSIALRPRRAGTLRVTAVLVTRLAAMGVVPINPTQTMGKPHCRSRQLDKVNRAPRLTNTGARRRGASSSAINRRIGVSILFKSRQARV